MLMKLDADTGDPWQNLANAIVSQAAQDFRDARKLLGKHQDISELRAAAKAAAKAARDARRAQGKGPGNRPLTPQEKALYSANHVHDTLSECRAFFRGRWFETLSDLDGARLLRRIEEEGAGDEGRACEDMAAEAETDLAGIFGDDDPVSWV